ncbi:MAG TPA: ATP-binding protein [Candidatus Binatia bacterium]|jgi:PAS domain S-box-containing protein|nr:ATP-binding protein [Candidatus Binatia bacterium]
MPKSVKRLIDLYRSHALIQLVLLVSVVGPLVLIAMYSYRSTERQMTEQTLSRRQSTAFVAAAALRGFFDRYVSIGESFASTGQFRDVVSAGRWQDAGKMLGNLPQQFPAIDHVFLTDVGGKVVADPWPAPDADADRSSEPWFRGMSHGMEPYVSGVYARRVPAPANIFTIAIPVKPAHDAASGPAAIMVMEFRTDALLDAARSVDAGLSGYVYFVDREGNLAAHPKYLPQGPIVDFSDTNAVRELRLGKSGVEIMRDVPGAEEAVVAYEPVREYGWGAVAAQPVAAAFSQRSERLSLIFYVFGFILAANLLLAYGILLVTRALKDAYDREKTFLMNAGDGIIATDAQGRVIMMNPQAEALLGWRFDQVEGEPFIEKLPLQNEAGEPVPLTFHPLTFALKLGQKKSTTTTPTHYFVRRDGNRFPVAITVTPLLKNGEVSGAMAVFRDITSEKEIDRSKSEFVSLASHQLLSPLSAVKGYASLLTQGDLGKIDPEQKRVAGNMLTLTDQMISLVSALLNVSRIELGSFAVEPIPVDAREIADSVAFELQGQLEAKRIKIVRKYDRDLPLIDADPELLRIVFQNLMTNAVRYSADGDEIAVTIEARPAFLYIAVADHGLGIPREAQGRIFTKFYRADNARIKEPAGNGLGLYIAKSIVTGTGGRIWFSSEENRGTTFFVTLPREGMALRGGTKKLRYKE